MSRARQPVPAAIRRLHYNPFSKKYEITEQGILYQLDLEHTRLLKEYFRGYVHSATRSISAWFEKLDHQTKKQITYSGNSITADDFYPDQ